MSALGSSRISKLQFSIGLTGTWRAEVWLDEGLATLGKQTLTVGDLVAVGTTFRGGNDAPDAPHVVHQGAPGWDRELAKDTTAADGVTVTSTTSAISYYLDAGVRVSTVLRDLARRANEPVELPAKDVVIGKHWVCIASRPGEQLYLRDALAALAKSRYVQSWRADLDGITRFGERSGGTVDTWAANVIRRDSAAGLAVLGTDTFRSVLPGATFEGAPITRLVVTEQPSNLEAEIWTRSPSIKSSVLRMVGEAWPQLVYGHPRTYRVGAVQGDGRLDLDPPADAPHLPPLQRVEVWGLGGARVKPRPGSLATVIFRDANPSRPVVVALEPLAQSTPTETAIDADEIGLGAAAGVVVRDGDTIEITIPGTPPTVVVTGMLGIKEGTAQNPPALSKVKA
jgi:hypothetical protein